MNLLARWLATWFGSGYFPKGPGTAGSLAAILCAIPAHQSILWLAVGGVLPAIWAANAHARALGAKDPQEIVVDEVAGQWITLAGATHLTTVAPWILAFLFFRAFDILKPPPVRWFEKLPGGVGIVMDDVIAGLMGAVVMRLLGWNNLY